MYSFLVCGLFMIFLLKNLKCFPLEFTLIFLLFCLGWYMKSCSLGNRKNFSGCQTYIFQLNYHSIIRDVVQNKKLISDIRKKQLHRTEKIGEL